MTIANNNNSNNKNDDNKNISFELGFTPCKSEQSLQGMELQEKEAQKDYSIQEIPLEGTYRLQMSVNSRLKTT